MSSRYAACTEITSWCWTCLFETYHPNSFPSNLPPDLPYHLTSCPSNLFSCPPIPPDFYSSNYRVLMLSLPSISPKGTPSILSSIPPVFFYAIFVQNKQSNPYATFGNLLGFGDQKFVDTPPTLQTEVPPLIGCLVLIIHCILSHSVCLNTICPNDELPVSQCHSNQK